MGEKDGVVKFNCDFATGNPPDEKEIGELMFWRDRFFEIGLIGQDSSRYGGAGYGNVSQRIEPFDGEHPRIVATATQTGGIPKLGIEGYVTVLECHPERNNVLVVESPTGKIKTTSEIFTHNQVYLLGRGIGKIPNVRSVVHVHSPLMWKNAQRLGMPRTNPSAQYGTPEMALETERIYPEAKRLGIFSMGGHEDGIVSFGSSPEEAASIMMAYYRRALELEKD